ncbi:S1 family peptidase [Streptomyces sp. NPDC003016]
MKHRRTFKRRVAMAGAGVAALMTAGVTFQTANASDETPRHTVKKLTATGAEKLASDLQSTLGDNAAGAYYDSESEELVVNVMNETAAQSVRKAGGKPRIVKNTLAELSAVRSALTGKATVPGTAWTTDPVTNKVVVTADRTVEGDAWAKLEKAVRAFGQKALLKKSAGEFKPLIAGGDAILSGSARCSLGFNVVKGGAPHFITAGHCGKAGSQWADSKGGALGTMAVSTFPGNDFALVKYGDGVEHPSEVNLYNGSTQPITRAGEAIVGMAVQRSGSTTEVHDGKVTALDATVNYGNGDVVNGLIQTTVCAEPGDSGGSLFTGDTAIGLTSGGSGNCTAGGETFFQPVPAALKALEAEIG